MQTFTFNELDERGKQAAISRYINNRDIERIRQAEHLAGIALEDNTSPILGRLPWRFNEHGERIA